MILRIDETFFADEAQRRLETNFDFFKRRWGAAAENPRAYIFADLYEAKLAGACREVQRTLTALPHDSTTTASLLRLIAERGLAHLYDSYGQLLFDHLCYGDTPYSASHATSPLAQSLHFISPSLGRWYRWPTFRTAADFRRMVGNPRSFDAFGTNYVNIPYDLNVSLDMRPPYGASIRLQVVSGAAISADGDTLRIGASSFAKLFDLLQRSSLTQILSQSCTVADLLKNPPEKDLEESELDLSHLASLLSSFVDAHRTPEVPRQEVDLPVSTRLLKSFIVTAAGLLALNPEPLAEKDIWLVPLYNVKPRPKLSAALDAKPGPGLIPAQKLGTWIVVTDQKLDGADLEDEGGRLVSVIREIEAPPEPVFRSFHVDLDYEKTLRECVYVNWAVFNRLNTLKELLESKREGARREFDHWEFFSKAACRSTAYMNLLDEISQVLGRETVDREADNRPVIKNHPIIFLYSEPGCGKEMLSETIFFLSRRGPSYKAKEVAEVVKAFTDEYETVADGIWGGTVSEDVVTERFREWDQNHRAKVRFAAVNCAVLPKDDCMRGLVGTVNQPSGLLEAHLRYGGIFLDEFNTLPVGSEHSLLRVMEKPHQVRCPSTSAPDSAFRTFVGVQPLIVIASNKTPQELIATGFNPAVVYRVTQNFFRVPPLRERREDIALSVLYMLLNWDKAYQPRRIELNALRLICELPWPDNYRGLKALIGDLEGQRRRTHLTSEVLSFDEVVSGIVRRHLIQGMAATFDLPVIRKAV